MELHIQSDVLNYFKILIEFINKNHNGSIFVFRCGFLFLINLRNQPLTKLIKP